MIIKHPTPEHYGALRSLWKQAFADSEDFLDSFFAKGFSPERCRCVMEQDRPVAVLYWFDCWLGERKLAYLYAVATRKDCRGRGLCRSLMADTHRHLEKNGYAGALLVPGERSLFGFYESLGYRTFGFVDQFCCRAAKSPVPLHRVSKEDYAARRRALLPAGGVIQEAAFMDLLAENAGLYAGEDFVLCAVREAGIMQIRELLGDSGLAPGILKALEAEEGVFRTPGQEQPFAMGMIFDAGCLPRYFGLALD